MSLQYDGFTGEENQVLPDRLLMKWRMSFQLLWSKGPPTTKCSPTKKLSSILVWFGNTLLGVTCVHSKQEANPFQEFRIFSLRGANVPHGHSQDFPNSLYQIDDNGCNTQKTVVSILFSVVSYKMDFLSNGFPLNVVSHA